MIPEARVLKTLPVVALQAHAHFPELVAPYLPYTPGFDGPLVLTWHVLAMQGFPTGAQIRGAWIGLDMWTSDSLGLCIEDLGFRTLVLGGFRAVELVLRMRCRRQGRVAVSMLLGCAPI